MSMAADRPSDHTFFLVAGRFSNVAKRPFEHRRKQGRPWPRRREAAQARPGRGDVLCPISAVVLPPSPDGEASMRIAFAHALFALALVPIAGCAGEQEQPSGAWCHGAQKQQQAAQAQSGGGLDPNLLVGTWT